ncbi:MAG: ABC transporter substrate-binding protein [Planctomycetes bacterium]|nr:ABC transporter substrate-binding protein [Planctomycetota bacterium]
MGVLDLVDGTGRHLQLDGPPTRIVSLVPSTTETCFVLGRGERVVGRTRYCIHPRPQVDALPDVGGTKAPDLARIAALRPDLVLANEEENRPALWPALRALAPLWVAFPRGVDGALDDLRAMSELLDARAAGAALCDAIASARDALRECATGRPFTYAYLIWKDPWMAAGDDTYIAALLAEAGGRNVAPAREAERYPRFRLDELVAADPDVVLLSSEPYAFTSDDASALGPLAARALPIDGEHCSWHGARLARALPYLLAFRDGPLATLLR